MTRIARPGLVLAAGATVSIAAALAPAGLHGHGVPASSWIAWGTVFAVGCLLAARAGGGFSPAARTLGWLLVPILLITIPAAFFAGQGRGAIVAAALVARALSAATMMLATVTSLGPTGTIAGLRALRVPARLVAIVHAMLVSLTAIGRQVAGMQRARSARRASATPWASLLAAPLETVRGFGSLAGALLLRSMERAESLERARRARGGAD
jgi:energy-coupling factor transporter transmembrane protein EcfT